MAKKREYIVTVAVRSAYGNHQYAVKATSEKDAIERCRDGGGVLIADETEVSLDFSRAEVEVNE